MPTVALTTAIVNHPLFGSALTQVAACAKEKFPDASARIERGALLVLADKVRAHVACSNAWIVQSQRLAGREYDIVENTCTCADYRYLSTAVADYACAHIWATWLYRRVEQRLAQMDAEPEYTPLPPDTGCQTPVDQDGTPCAVVAPACAHQALALPEAPASVNVRLPFHGREIQLTLRDTDEHRLLDRLEALLQRFPSVGVRHEA
jgi:predicted nucleic acid-binding Zn finger protein